jgi:hypothetical protein
MNNHFNKVPAMNKVPEVIRKRNKLSVEKRAAWRVRYALLTASIRAAKQQVRSRPTDARAQIELEGLRALAQIMMLERGMITWDLRDSAYRWV